jgi:hypothetical protein
MRLYFNGCSHTWGDDLDDPLQQSWPSLISKKLNCDFLNHSVSGGTNDRIMYQTIKNIDQFDKFYIAWTYTTRFTRYRTDNNHDVNFNPQLVHTVYGKNSEFKDYGQLHYKFWHNELYAFKIWLQNIILLQKFFESVNKPYLMLNAADNFIDHWTVSRQLFNNSVQSLLCFDLMDDNQLSEEHAEIQHLVNKIDFSKFIGWKNWHITKLCGQYPVGATGHLLDQGHQQIAEYILNHDTFK